ncbi:hypothetical protein A3H22_00895 [Candidatus Peribacteria bacterium RIFCSPLOWO2_12_FULL_55_15]|nr:MAG: hypothetical protein A2789_00655 [Candidatus Peribacteria bacterium RIFCSPHIGHO2_01_FULL_54_22]OGJ63570.1 MAG: hypothetical protein A3D12_03930 [Candidatus Peribacteria bacterium RIFCSPHIGHO2_02_FULL_55_24]OGJ67640.1 MAG: hypothetical protein A2947_00590 [Candidatus Peribacteria bacterium RIFCSPLOWO2_01_FULL_54_110]OGJ69557.1 MAG: hypothetical protein A3H90_02830 [Candidatus Peribacteria bacterium RIFCSPLOWO2_02_FULL_55_36]OGJ70207.1 MAG: hypothetical protein A3H22_00895 [Candidatus Per
MVQIRISGYAFLGFLLVATPVFARVVISEVMWMGSDLSTADEWVEIVGVNDGVTSFPLSMSGWTLRIQSGTGESIIARLGDSAIASGQYLVVSNYPVAESRLAADPVLTTTAMVLPNTKLLLRLYDAGSTLIDEMDDGIGVPFAGDNPSGGGPKASMERISLLGAWNVKENWQTALRTLGFDSGAPIFGTPGFPRLPSSDSSSSSVFSFSSTFTSSSSTSSWSSTGSGTSSGSSAVSSVSTSCVPDVSNIRIAIQSGEPRSEGKVTVNLQLLWDGNGAIRCIWDYRDGFTSASCNPPSHTFTVPGTYDVRVEAEDACGGKTVQTLPIEVLTTVSGGGGGGTTWRASGSSESAGSCMPRTFGGVEIMRFLPNPDGKDLVGEWVELRNISDRVAFLCGWTLDDAEGGSTPFSLEAVTLASKEIRRFPASFTGIGFNNDQDHVRLFSPGDLGNHILVQDVPYTNARDGVVMDAMLPTQGTNGRVVRVIDGDTVMVRIADREVTVRLIGVDAPETGGKGEEGKWGREAMEFLRGLLDGGIVALDFDEERQDVYGRILAYLSVGGRDVQAELLQVGLAAVYKRCTCVRKEEYRRFEEEAREKKVGMWGGGRRDGDEVRQVGTVGEGGKKEGEKAAVFLSEVYPVPLPAEGEWVEIWNSANKPVDLSGWGLDDAEKGGSRSWKFPEGFIIQPGAFIVLRSDQTHLAFNNEGDSVALIAPDGIVVDRIVYGKLRRGHTFARIIQRIGSTGAFRATDRFCVTDHPTPFERNICRVMVSVDEPSRRQGHVSPLDYARGDTTSSILAPLKTRRVVRIARRMRYRNVLPPSVLSGSIATPDPMLAALLERMDRSVQSGQVVWGEEGTSGEGRDTMEWEAVLLPFLLIAGAHSLLIGVRRGL